MKNHALFSSKDKSKKLKCCLLQFLFGALRVIIVLDSLQILKITCQFRYDYILLNMLFFSKSSEKLLLYNG